MKRITTDVRLAGFALAVCALAASGCSGLPRIDPSGQRFFLPPAPPGTSPCQPGIVVPTDQAPVYQAPAYQAPASGAFKEVPGPSLCGDAQELILSPRLTIAPVGSEVVLLAGVHGGDQYLRTNQRVEWTIAPTGPGQFVELGKNGVVDWLLGDFNHPRKTGSTTAIAANTSACTAATRRHGMMTPAMPSMEK